MLKAHRIGYMDANLQSVDFKKQRRSGECLVKVTVYPDTSHTSPLQRRRKFPTEGLTREDVAKAVFEEAGLLVAEVVEAILGEGKERRR